MEKTILNVIALTFIMLLTLGTAVAYPQAIIDIENVKLSELSEENRDIYIYLQPEAQKTDTGDAIYTIIMARNSPAIVAEETGNALTSPIVYLEFNSNEKGVLGQFEKNQIEIMPAQTAKTTLTVKASERGKHFFTVTARSATAAALTDIAQANGILIYEDENVIKDVSATDTLPIEGYNKEGVLFNGKGFALQIKPSETKGHLVKLVLLNNRNNPDQKNFNGQFQFADSKYKVKDFSSSLSEINLALIDVTTGRQFGILTSNIREFPSFSLMEGTLELEDSTWKITLVSEKERVFATPIEVSKETVTSVTEIQNIVPVVIKQKDDDIQVIDEKEKTIYIKPTEIRDKKILWIIPTGEKVVDIEITSSSGETKQKTLTTSQKTKLSDYGIEIEVKSVTENEVEFAVEKITN